MRRITIFSAGSTGDVQPCALLGKSLQQAGFPVVLAAPQNFSGLAQAHGLAFHPLRGDVQAIMAGDTGREFMEKGGANPLRAMLAMRQMIAPIAMQMAEDALAACQEAEALISLAVFAPFGKTIAEIHGIPLINVEPTPVLPSGDFPAAGWPIQRDLGRAHNRLAGHAMLRLIWQWYAPAVNEFRKQHGLGRLNGGCFSQILRSNPLLGAYSPHVIPHPPDWPEKAHITGYWFQEAGHSWQPTPELQAFLAQGEPPVYVGFGSMGGQDPERLAGMALEALAKSGQRGLLLTGWGGMRVKDVPEDVLVIPSAPHSWLFPRMTAVVHHGGAGTTAEGYRAGVPTITVPFIVDQPWWGKRTQALGVGTEPIPAKRLTADRLAQAIQAATSDTKMKARAAALGQAIRAEDGLGRAVKIIQGMFGG